MQRASIFLSVVLAMMLVTTAAAINEWSEDRYTEFVKGEVENVSITSRGELQLAPQLTEVFDTEEPYIWTATSDAKGNIFLGTGNNGKVFKVTPGGQGSLFFDAEELEATALATDKAGNLYVGTSPDGKVYHVAPDGTAATYFDPEETYIWALLMDDSGILYAATGNSGKIYKITAQNQATVLYENDDMNITAMVFDRGGDLVIGTDGKGYIARVTTTGDVFVLHDVPQRQVHALAVADDGTIYAASIDDRKQMFQAPPPRSRSGSDQSPQGSDGMEDDDAGSMDEESTGPAIMMPPTEIYGGSSSEHGLFKISPDGAVQELRTSKKNVTMALAINGRGELIIGTGDDGKFYTVDERDRVTLLLKIKESQVTAFATSPDGVLYAATSNLGKLMRFDKNLAASGSFTSEPMDAGMFARWGRIAWDGDFQNGAVKLYTRSGNTEEPDGNWSDWDGPYTNHTGENVSSPGARFIQYKVELERKGETSPLVSAVSVIYKQRNMSPRVKAILVNEPGEGSGFPSPFGGNSPPSFSPDGSNDPMSGSNPMFGSLNDKNNKGKKSKNSKKSKTRGLQTVTWIATDDNDDNLIYDLQFKGTDEKTWKKLTEDLSKNSYSWNTEQMPDGEYQIKVKASDRPDNPLDEAMSDSLISEVFIVDNTPPTASKINTRVVGKKVNLTFTVSDELSTLDRVEYSVDLGDWELVSPDDHICDSYSEDFDFQTESLESGEHYIIVRLTDDQENQKVVKTVVTIP